MKPYSFVSGKFGDIVSFKFNKKQIKALLKIQWWNWSDEKIQEYIHLLNGNIDTFLSALSDFTPFNI